MQEAQLAISDQGLGKTSCLAETTRDQFERVLAVISQRFAVPRAQIRLLDIYLGTINTIFEISLKERHYGIKLRTHEDIFQYEKRIIKEVVVAALLLADAKQPPLQCIASIIEKSSGGPFERTEFTPRIEYYDWSRDFVAVPFVVYDWIDAQPLSEIPNPLHYKAAGKLLQTLHQVVFPCFIAAFDSGEKEQSGWPQRFSLLLSSTIEQATPFLSNRLASLLKRISVPVSVQVNTGPCLVHNDFYGSNILVSPQSQVTVIDWDNAAVDCPHLDFIKMRYWTTKRGGTIVSDDRLFHSFVSGYGPQGEEIVSSPVFRFYELLWLLRVYKFEMLKEKKGLPLTPGFPPAAAYLPAIEHVLASLA